MKIESKSLYFQKRQLEAANTMKSLKLPDKKDSQDQISKSLGKLQKSHLIVQTQALTPIQTQVDNKLLSKRNKESEEIFFKTNSERLFHTPTQVNLLSVKDKSPMHHQLHSNASQNYKVSVTENIEVIDEFFTHRPQGKSYFNSQRKADLPDHLMKIGINDMVEAKTKLMDLHESDSFSIKNKFFKTNKKIFAPRILINNSKNMESSKINFTNNLLQSKMQTSNNSYDNLRPYEIDDLLKKSKEERSIEEKRLVKNSPIHMSPLFTNTDFKTYSAIPYFSTNEADQNRQTTLTCSLTTLNSRIEETEIPFPSCSVYKINLKSREDSRNEKFKSSLRKTDLYYKPPSSKIPDSKLKSSKLLSPKTFTMGTSTESIIDLELTSPFKKKKVECTLSLNGIRRLEAIEDKNYNIIEPLQMLSIVEGEDLSTLKRPKEILRRMSKKNIIPSKHNLFRLEPSKSILKRLCFTKE